MVMVMLTLASALMLLLWSQTGLRCLLRGGGLVLFGVVVIVADSKNRVHRDYMLIE